MTIVIVNQFNEYFAIVGSSSIENDILRPKIK